MQSELFHRLIQQVRAMYGEGAVPLHRPVFEGNERQYVVDCIDSNFVSSVGAKVSEFEQRTATYTGAKYAIATVNGTAALHVALQLAGVKRDDEVITQALTFVATCNALSYAGAHPVFVDVDRDTLGLSPKALRCWLSENGEL
ncbi:MAG: aminotransferase class I/II-fold pyridoxal phosphate-dependent enzyme, partial [Gammaproteobacteria bacterium]|nr:aminotransferase class I/II-fold pyridoxal phosphate-dependent enzyme [Gammaproteobacteria bacterium]